MTAERPHVAWAEVTIDSCDTARAAEFWSSLLDLPARPAQPEGWFQLGPATAGGPVINIQPVPEAKVGKSRIHLDFWVSNLEAAIALAERLGARRVEDHTHGQWRIAVMADPEGIEFCLVA